MTPSNLLGIELLRLLRYSVQMSWVHIFRIASFNFGTEEMSWLLCLFFKKFQSFSIGFRSSKLVLEEAFNPRYGSGPILQEAHAAVNHHEGKEVVLEHFLIMLSVHCHVWWKEKDL
jgi:hypothetical protein